MPIGSRQSEREVGEFFRRLTHGFRIGAEFEVGRERRLVGRIDAVEVAQLTRPRPAIPGFGVAAFALGERCIDIDLGEPDAARARSATCRRSSRNGESSAAASPVQRMFSLRSAGLKPRSRLSPVPIKSPSRTTDSTRARSNSAPKAVASVVFPAPDRPVSQMIAASWPSSPARDEPVTAPRDGFAIGPELWAVGSIGFVYVRPFGMVIHAGNRLSDSRLELIMTSLVIINTFKLYLLSGKRKHSCSHVGNILQVIQRKRFWGGGNGLRLRCGSRAGMRLF
jgi:hypothetical protein